MVTSRAEPLDRDKSMMSALARVHLTYQPAGCGPSSVIVKSACEEPIRRQIAERFDFYSRELSLYRHVADSVQIRTPRCFAAVQSTASGEFTLILEDLDGMRAIDQADGCPWQEALIVAEALAGPTRRGGHAPTSSPCACCT